MLTGKTTLPHSAGTPARLTLICSSSPSPPPVRLSPMCSTDPSGLCRLLKNTKWPSDRTRPFMSSMIADASRSKSAPVVVRGSQPSPTTTAESPGACFESDTLPPLLRLTLTFCSLVRMRLYEYAKSLPVAGDLTHQRQYTVLPAPMKEDESWARVVLSNMLRLYLRRFFLCCPLLSEADSPVFACAAWDGRGSDAQPVAHAARRFSNLRHRQPCGSSGASGRLGRLKGRLKA